MKYVLKKLIHILICLLVLSLSVSCEKTQKTTSATLYIYGYFGVSPKIRDYTLTRKVSYKIQEYKYVHEEDSMKNMKFSFNINSETLKFANHEFMPILESEYL